MDGSRAATDYPVVLRFEGLYPHQLAGYEAHRMRKRGNLAHVDAGRSHLNRRLIGDADWDTSPAPSCRWGSWPGSRS